MRNNKQQTSLIQFDRNNLLFCEPFYNIFWKRCSWYLSRLLYVLIPFVLVTVLGSIIVNSGACTTTSTEAGESFYSFTADYSNCFSVCYVFLFMYFTNGFFVQRFKNATDEYVNECQIDNALDVKKRIRLVMVISDIICFVICVLFLLGAKEAINEARSVGGERYWYSKLISYKHWGFYLYKLLICYSWFLSGRLFLSAIVNAIAIYSISRRSPKLSRNATRKIAPLTKYLSASLGFGVYILVAVGIILYSDYCANRDYQMAFGVQKLKGAVIVLTILLSAFYFFTISIGYVYLVRTIRSNAIAQSFRRPRRIATSSVVVFLFSALLPGLAALLQLMAPLARIINFIEH